jgi:hypothetical protein
MTPPPPLVRVIVPLQPKFTVSPAAALPITLRNVLSLQVLTVSVAARTGRTGLALHHRVARSRVSASAMRDSDFDMALAFLWTLLLPFL